jgi:O-antigen/teichoic acid export membrane protein
VPSLRRNITANFAGKLWATALGLVFPPIYARLLGIESYGLVGVWSSLTAVLGILDLGLSTTLTREMARYSTDHDESSHREMRDTVRTIEVVFWAVGTVAGAGIVVLAPLVAHHWVNAQHISSDLVARSIRVMGIAFALQWPMGVYNGGLLGLQKQVTANVIQVAFTTIRVLGAAILVWKISSAIDVFFVWQAAVMAAQTLVTRVALATSLPGRESAGTFQWELLVRNWRFSTGMFFISILAIALTQTDKLIVSKLLPLAQFGYYTLAWAVGGALANLTNPVFVAVFPRLTQIAKKNEPEELSRVYHTSCQIISVVLLPAAAVLALFSREVLTAWSGDPRLIAEASHVVAIVAIGTACNGLMNIPYALMLAFAWTRLNAVANLIAILLLAPMEYWLTKSYGLTGAATGWLTLNASYVVILMPIIHRRLLRGELWRWYLVDVGLPLAGIATVVLPIRWLVDWPGGRFAACAYLAGIGIVAVAAAAMAAPASRERGLALIGRWRALLRTA